MLVRGAEPMEKRQRRGLLFDKILDLTQVKSVTVGGVEIPMP